MRRIAIINQKGGVAKTTTAANLGAALARSGLRVLLVDLDSQANLSLHISGDEGPTAGPSTFELLVDGIGLRQVAREVEEEGLWLAKASPDLAGIEQALANSIGRELLLRDALEAEADRFDVVLIDCPPSLGVLSLNALAAAEYVLIPLQTEFFALQGMTQLMEVIGVVQSRLNPALELLGILPSMIDARTRLSSEVVEDLRTHFSDKLLDSRIRKNVKLAEAPSFGQSIFQYAPESNGAADYLGLAAEIARRVELELAPMANPGARDADHERSAAEPEPEKAPETGAGEAHGGQAS